MCKGGAEVNKMSGAARGWICDRIGKVKCLGTVRGINLGLDGSTSRVKLLRMTMQDDNNQVCYSGLVR